MDLDRLIRTVRLIKKAQGYLGEIIDPAQRQWIINAVTSGQKIPIDRVLSVSSAFPKEKLAEIIKSYINPSSLGMYQYGPLRESLVRALEAAHVHGITDPEILSKARVLGRYEVSPLTLDWLRKVSPSLAWMIERNERTLVPHPHYFQDLVHRSGKYRVREKFLPDWLRDTLIPGYGPEASPGTNMNPWYSWASRESAQQRAIAKVREMRDYDRYLRRQRLKRWGKRGAIASLLALITSGLALGYKKLRGD